MNRVSRPMGYQYNIPTSGNPEGKERKGQKEYLFQEIMAQTLQI